MSRRVADYECRYCKTVVEAPVGEPPAECATCGGPVKRIYAKPGIALRGEGWAGPRSR